MSQRVLFEFPTCLTSRQRALLHSVAEALKLEHASKDAPDGSRYIVLGAPDGKKQAVLPRAKAVADAKLRAALTKAFGDAAGTAFDQAAGQGATGSTSTKPSSSCSKSGSQASPANLADWVVKTTVLLDKEHEAEIAVASGVDDGSTTSTVPVHARGAPVLNLRVAEMEGGLLGSTLVTLVNNKGWAGGAAAWPVLPPHNLGTHDVVAVRANKGPTGCPLLAQGVVYRIKETSVIVALDDAPDEELNMPVRLEKLANEATWKRLRSTLGTLGSIAAGQSQGLPGEEATAVMFGRRAPRFVDKVPKWEPVNKGLDETQRQAVELALRAQDFALVHGPPGTGKTTTVVEIVLQEVARGSKVLVAAASNIAVDNVVERLARANPKLKVVRVGHPARLLPEVLNNSLEAHVLRADNSALARDCRAEMKQANQQLGRLGPRDRAQRRELRQQLRGLAKEERQRQSAAVKEVIAGAHVLCATLTGVLQYNLKDVTVDVVVVDEAAQALEVATWGAVLRGRKAVLAGDHLQLPPTVLSTEAESQGLGVTLFERLQRMWSKEASCMLNVQYRMHHAIMDWASHELYEGKLVAHESVAEHTLADLAGTGGGGGLEEVAPLVLVDTAGCDMEEAVEEEGGSRYNEGEAKVVMEHVKVLLKAGLQPSAVGIITPYSAQVRLLREMRPPELRDVEINTVDGFQGREKEAIIISMVRSSTGGEVGFLADNRRINVAITRARRHCVVVCNTECVSTNPFLKRLVEYIEEHGEYRLAVEFE